MARLADSARAALIVCWFYAITGSPVTMFAERLADHGGPSPRHALMHATTCSYVFSAYPLWRLAHPTEDCPARLEDLGAFTRFPDLYDPGTGQYFMRCDPRTHRMTVWSEDDRRIPGTAGGTAASNGRTIAAQSCRFDVRPW